MNTNNEWQEGVLQFQNSKLHIRLTDGSTHVVTEDDYVECLQLFTHESHTFEQYCPLNQQFADGIWYFDRCSCDMNGRPARFRKALLGERRKNGVLVVEKGKLFIDLWDNSKQEISSGTWIEMNLPLKSESERTFEEWTKMVWKRCRVEFDAATKKWVYFDTCEKAHAVENDTLTRIAY